MHTDDNVSGFRITKSYAVPALQQTPPSFPVPRVQRSTPTRSLELTIAYPAPVRSRASLRSEATLTPAPPSMMVHSPTFACICASTCNPTSPVARHHPYRHPLPPPNSPPHKHVCLGCYLRAPVRTPAVLDVLRRGRCLLASA